MPSRYKPPKNQQSVAQMWSSSSSVPSAVLNGKVTPEKKGSTPFSDDDTETTAPTLASAKSNPNKDSTDLLSHEDDQADVDSSDDELAASQALKNRAKKLHFNEANIRETSTPQKKSKSNNHGGPVNIDLLPMNTFKAVDHRSTNRRECIRLNDEEHPFDPTGSSSNDEYMHMFKTRVSVKLSVPSSEKPETTLMHRIKEFVVELKNADDSLAIFPWKTKDYG